MKHLGIILASIILVLAFATEAKNPHAREIKTWKMELALIEKHLEQLPNDPALDRERKHLQEQQMHIVKVLQGLDPKGDYSAYLPKSAEQPTADNGTTSNAAESEDVVSEVQSKANPNEEITLTVTSDGPTKDEAIKNALRTAIEQAYGAFVSANTTILNDELVKDEIVTVSNGSIKEYKILSEYQKADGTGYGVTANATVSLPHLITYAKSHGSECEFAGNTFGMEIKMFNLQKENELKALYNSIPQIKEIAKACNHHDLNIHEPILISYNFEYETSQRDGFTLAKEGRININYNGLNLRNKGFYMLNKPVKQSNGWRAVAKDDKALSYFESLNDGQNALIEFDIFWKPDRAYTLATTITKLLGSLSVDDATYDKYIELGLNPHIFDMSDYFDIFTSRYNLRNSHKELAIWCDSLRKTLNEVCNNFVIIDNSGQISDFAPFELANLCMPYLFKYVPGHEFYQYPYLKEPELQYLNNRQSFEYCYESRTGYGWYESINEWFNYCFHIPGKLYKFRSHELLDTSHGDFSLECIGASGIFSKLFFLKHFYPNTIKMGSEKILWKAYVVMPMSEIGKYSSFKVVPKE